MLSVFVFLLFSLVPAGNLKLQLSAQTTQTGSQSDACVWMRTLTLRRGLHLNERHGRRTSIPTLHLLCPRQRWPSEPGDRERGFMIEKTAAAGVAGAVGAAGIVSYIGGCEGEHGEEDYSQFGFWHFSADSSQDGHDGPRLRTHKDQNEHCGGLTMMTSW